MAPVEWRASDSPVAYDAAIADMEARAAAIATGRAAELVWLLEHPPLYTAGTSANPGDVIDARFPVHETGRGGQIDLSRPGPASRLRDARSQTPRARRTTFRCHA